MNLVFLEPPTGTPSGKSQSTRPSKAVWEPIFMFFSILGGYQPAGSCCAKRYDAVGEAATWVTCMDTMPRRGCRRLAAMQEITGMRIVCRLWKTARIPLLSIGQERETGFAQLLCGYALSEDSTFCAKLTYNAVLCLGVAEGEGRGEIVFVLHMNLIRNQFVSCDHKKKYKGRG